MRVKRNSPTELLTSNWHYLGFFPTGAFCTTHQGSAMGVSIYQNNNNSLIVYPLYCPLCAEANERFQQVRTTFPDPVEISVISDWLQENGKGRIINFNEEYLLYRMELNTGKQLFTSKNINEPFSRLVRLYGHTIAPILNSSARAQCLDFVEMSNGLARVDFRHTDASYFWTKLYEAGYPRH